MKTKDLEMIIRHKPKNIKELLNNLKNCKENSNILKRQILIGI